MTYKKEETKTFDINMGNDTYIHECKDESLLCPLTDICPVYERLSDDPDGRYCSKMKERFKRKSGSSNGSLKA